MRRLLPLLGACAALAPATAAAQEPASARMRLEAVSGLRDGGQTFVARGQRVEVRGTVSQFAPLQFVTVEILRRGRQVAAVRLLIRQHGDAGRFTVRFRVRRAAKYVVRARHEPTPEQQELIAEPVSVNAVVLQAGPGSNGREVRLLQRGLGRLGFVTSHGGGFDAATSRAVMAFRKTNGMARTGFASRAVFQLLLSGRGRFRLRYPQHGKHVEADLARQVLALARDGRVERVYHMSSGAGGTPTVLGSFRFYLKTPGTNARGMVHSNYFIRGYAVHGYPSVPPFPASHGCLRVPIPNALAIFRWIHIGDRIDVYR
jgi:hypothetical protein